MQYFTIRNVFNFKQLPEKSSKQLMLKKNVITNTFLLLTHSHIR